MLAVAQGEKFPAAPWRRAFEKMVERGLFERNQASDDGLQREGSAACDFVTPAMAAGLTDRVWEDIIALLDAQQEPKKRGSYKKRGDEISN